jgi:hypothetical protein
MTAVSKSQYGFPEDYEGLPFDVNTVSPTTRSTPRVELEATIIKQRTKIGNYRRAMKQLQRAHVVTLYAKQRAEEALQHQSQYINDMHAELQALRAEIAATRDVALRRGEALRDARNSVKNRGDLVV